MGNTATFVCSSSELLKKREINLVLSLTSFCVPTALPGDVNFEELARSCDDFNGAQLKAVCVEAGMLALRREAEQARKNGSLYP